VSCSSCSPVIAHFPRSRPARTAPLGNAARAYGFFSNQTSRSSARKHGRRFAAACGLAHFVQARCQHDRSKLKNADKGPPRRRGSSAGQGRDGLPCAGQASEAITGITRPSIMKKTTRQGKVKRIPLSRGIAVMRQRRVQRRDKPALLEQQAPRPHSAFIAFGHEVHSLLKRQPKDPATSTPNHPTL